MEIKLDTKKEGMETHMRPYEATALNVVWDAEKPIGSGKVWKNLAERGICATGKAQGSGRPVSRAAVIFFLNRMVDDGVFDFDDATGKGGHHRLYYPAVSREEYPEHVVNSVLKGLVRTFPGNLRIMKLAELALELEV